MEQLEIFDQEYLKYANLHQRSIVKKTGCLIPCSYTEFKLANEPTKFDNGTQSLILRFSSPDVLERTEQLLYPTDSFISEFGGALGLLLGFSCMMIWDGLELLFHYCLKHFCSVRASTFE